MPDSRHYTAVTSDGSGGRAVGSVALELQRFRRFSGDALSARGAPGDP